MTQQKLARFADLLTLHVSNTVKKNFLNESLNSRTLHAIRDCVHKTIADVFNRSSHRLTPEALNWVSNQYFRAIQIGSTEGKQSINDMVVFNDYKLADMPFSDIQLMRNLFNETAMSAELEAEYRRRNAS
jgi:hypothetical protein